MKPPTTRPWSRHAARRGALLLAAVLATSWLSGCERAKTRLDREVDRLCAIDGGVKVFETVKVSPEVYAEFLRDPGRRVEVIFGADYRMTSSEEFIVEGNPSLSRMQRRLVRQSDKKVLGTSTSYLRRGGDLPSPSHPSFYSCPAIGQVGVVGRVFIPEGNSK